MTENNTDYQLTSNETNSFFGRTLCDALVLTFEDFLKRIEDFILGSEDGFLGGTPLQLQILQVFVVALIVILVLVAFAWQTYSQRISQTLSSNQYTIIEELLKKNSPLKLPREHSPRY